MGVFIFEPRVIGTRVLSEARGARPVSLEAFGNGCPLAAGIARPIALIRLPTTPARTAIIPFNLIHHFLLVTSSFGIQTLWSWPTHPPWCLKKLELALGKMVFRRESH